MARHRARVFHVSAVPREQVHVIADRVVELLRGCERFTNGRYTAEDMVALCVAGNSYLFICFDSNRTIVGAVVCVINQYPGGRWLFIQFIGGDSTVYWRQNMYDLLEKFAEDHDCRGIEGIGRIGWGRLFPWFRPMAIMWETDVRGRRQFTAITADSHTD